MDSTKALAILAFCAGVHAAALPQILGLGAGTATTPGKTSVHNPREREPDVALKPLVLPLLLRQLASLLARHQHRLSLSPPLALYYLHQSLVSFGNMWRRLRYV